jgi:hypothetical protein
MKSIQIIFLLTIFSLNNIISRGQEVKPEYDTAYIQSYHDYLVITGVSVYNSNSIDIADNLNKEISFATNLPFYFGIAIDYKWFTFEYTKNIKTQLDKNKGKTDSRGIGIGITGRKFWFRSFYKDYEGYFMENPEYDNPEFNEEIDPYPLRPDLHSRIFFANLNYGFNSRKFSNTASLWQLERQKKGAGSFTIGLSAAFTKVEADSALILPKWEANFNPDALITNYHYTMIGINGGYLRTFPMFKKRRFFLSLAFVPGFSYQFGEARIENNPMPVKKNLFGGQAETRIVLGYIHEKWYTSLSANFYSFSNAFAQENSIVQGYNFLRIVYGRKIKVKETKSSFLKKIGL